VLLLEINYSNLVETERAQMAVKIYKLIIEFDSDSEEIEFIEESVTEDAPDGTYMGKLNVGSYFDDNDKDITELLQYFTGEIGES
jgi:methyl coenzyme M reductase subunit D